MKTSWFSLSTSLDKIIDSFHHAYSQLTEITKYRDIMREFYSTGMSKEKTKYFNITKADIYSMFIVPEQTNNLIPKRDVCAWIGFISRHGKRIGWKCGSMVFDKCPCNIREVPLYFIRKLLVDITEFQGHGIGSSQDQPTTRYKPIERVTHS